MRLLTNIPPRRDGTVILRAKDGTAFIFRDADGSGDLVCDVPDDDLVASALRSGFFEPADAEDNAVAEVLLMAGEPGPEGDEDLDDDDSDDEDSDDEDTEALPLEANTPPAAPPVKRGPGRPRKIKPGA
jgi:hypothetical protein